MHKPTNKEMLDMNSIANDSVLNTAMHNRTAVELEKTAQQAWQSVTDEEIAGMVIDPPRPAVNDSVESDVASFNSSFMAAHMRKMHGNAEYELLERKFGSDDTYVPPKEDMTILVFDRSDFLHGIDKDDMVPALVLCDRKADTLLRRVVESSVENLQTFLSTGVKPDADYSSFAEVNSFDDEDDVESIVSPAASQVINRMVMMADNLLKDTIDPNVLRDADITTVHIHKNRLEIKISK